MARICIATLDPRMEGGVPTMARFVYETAEMAGHDPYLAFNRVDLSEDIRPWELPTRGLSVEPVETTVDGMAARYVPRVLPEFEFLQYVLNGDAWEEMIADADICFGVGGNNQCCHPFSRAGRTFGCWVATPMWADRTDRLASSSPVLRLRDRLSKPFLERIENRIYRDASVVYALSEYTASTVADSCDIDRREIEVVPYPVDTEVFSPGANEPGVEEPRVLFVGRYNDPRKNTPMLLRAFEQVKAEIPDATLELIGDDPAPDLLSLAEKLGIDDAVEFIKYVPNEELPQYYRDADVFVISSHQEGLAIVGLEAMACGTPVVSTRCGGPEEYVKDGETGYLVPDATPETFAGRVQELLTDSEKQSLFGQRARSLIEENFAREIVEDRFNDVFEQLLT